MKVEIKFGINDDAFVTLRSAKMTECKRCRCTRKDDAYEVSACSVVHIIMTVDLHGKRQTQYIVVPYKRKSRRRITRENGILVEETDLFSNVHLARAEACRRTVESKRRRKVKAWNQR